ncbi:MAG: hypothetical protein KC731_32480, partial [Myxococcales bacterium]|nr:hypothetical protein [Myxococcales bacterium]
LAAIAVVLGSWLGAGDARAQEHDGQVAVTEWSPPLHPPLPDPEPLPIAGFDRGFFIQSPDGNNRLDVGARIQTRFTYQEHDDGDRFAFAIPRAWLRFGGHVLSPDLRFMFIADFGSKGPRLLDAFVDYRAVPGWLHVRLGAWRKPFSRQTISPLPRLAFVERPFDNKAYAGSLRDLGFAIHNGYEKPPTFSYVIGVFNGGLAKGIFSDDPDEAANNRLDPIVTARLAYASTPGQPYGEIDFSGEPRITIGVAGQARLDADRTDDASVTFGGDVGLQGYGLSLVGQALTRYAQTGPSFGDLSYDGIGMNLQAGYLFAERLQPAVRYARVFGPEADDDRQEILAGLSVFIDQHHIKAGIEAGPVIQDDPAGPTTHWVARAQLHLDLF